MLLSPSRGPWRNNTARGAKTMFVGQLQRNQKKRKKKGKSKETLITATQNLLTYVLHILKHAYGIVLQYIFSCCYLINVWGHIQPSNSVCISMCVGTKLQEEECQFSTVNLKIFVPTRDTTYTVNQGHFLFNVDIII